MQMFRKSWAVIAWLAVDIGACVSCSAQSAHQPFFDPARHMHISEVRPGMKGYGLSVFMGTKIERFDVEVISILRNFNLKSDVILIRFSGDNLEHNLAIAGMSGSPIYLFDDSGKSRMIGAFAYGWQLQKDPIAGVQPIEYMLQLPDSLSVHASHPSEGSSPPKDVDDHRRAHWSFDEPKPLNINQTTNGTERAVGLLPLSTPLMVAGLSPQLMRTMNPFFTAHGLMPMQGGGGQSVDGPEPKIEPGCVIGVPLINGDAEMNAVGTCTEVIGNEVFAFGHSFNSEGKVSLPLAGGSIQGIVANLASSFKIGSLFSARGTLQNDQTVGICGEMGHSPASVPIELHVKYADGSQDQTYHFTTALHSKLTPTLVATALAAGVTGTKELPENHTVDYDLNLEFKNGKQIRISNTAVNTSAGDLCGEVVTPLTAAIENPFESVMVKKITGSVVVSNESRSGQILFASVSKSRYRPGETVTAYVTFRPFRAADIVVPISLELPRDMSDGTYQLSISDSQKYLADERIAEPFRFTAESTDEMFSVLQDAAGIRHDAIYMRLNRQPDGVAIGHTAMPRLPSSRRQIMIGAGRSDITQFVSSILKVHLTGRVMSGSADFEITIDKNADNQAQTQVRLPRRDVEPAVK